MDATGIISRHEDDEVCSSQQDICIGQALRDARLRAGLELHQVSADLKINTEYLQAIEEMDRAALPHQTYTLGFVRCYASYLGFNGQESVDSFKLDGTTATTSHRDVLRKSPPFWLNFTVPRGFGLTIAVIGMVALASWFGKNSITTPHNIPPVPEMLGNWSKGTDLQNIPAISAKPEQIEASDS